MSDPTAASYETRAAADASVPSRAYSHPAPFDQIAPTDVAINAEKFVELLACGEDGGPCEQCTENARGLREKLGAEVAGWAAA